MASGRQMPGDQQTSRQADVLFLSFNPSFLIILPLKTVFRNIHIWRPAVSASRKKIDFHLIKQGLRWAMEVNIPDTTFFLFKHKIWFYLNNFDIFPSEILDVFPTLSRSDFS